MACNRFSRTVPGCPSVVGLGLGPPNLHGSALCVSGGAKQPIADDHLGIGYAAELRRRP